MILILIQLLLLILDILQIKMTSPPNIKAMKASLALGSIYSKEVLVSGINTESEYNIALEAGLTLMVGDFLK